jgi:hypothetical protein
MRIHLAQQAGPCDPWLTEITAYVLVENNGVLKEDTVIQITGWGYFWRSDLYHLAEPAAGR